MDAGGESYVERPPVGATPRVVGPLTRAQVDVLEPGTTVVGLRFHPGAAAAVLGVPASELLDLALTADESWGAGADELGEAIGSAPSPDLALAQYAIAHGRPATDDGLALLAAEAGYADQPHLNRECVRLTGETPGAFLGQTQASCACGHDHSASFAPVLQARRRA